MLRPRESRSLRLLDHELVITPAATVGWAFDVAGNSVATATFHEASDTLSINSTAVLTLDVEQWPIFDIAATPLHISLSKARVPVVPSATKLSAHLRKFPVASR